MRLPRCDDGDVRGTLRTVPRADILKVGLKIGFGEPGLSKAHRLFLSRASASQPTPGSATNTTNTTHTHLCMCPRADLRRGLHHLDLMRALHAPQLPNERRERPPLASRNDVEIRRRLRLCVRIEVIGRGGALTAREVILEERRRRRGRGRAPMSVSVALVAVMGAMGTVAIVTVMRRRRHVDVHVLGARRECAEVIDKVLERTRVVRAEERHDVLEARRRAVPFFFGWVFARAVEEHAEATRRARLLCVVW